MQLSHENATSNPAGVVLVFEPIKLMDIDLSVPLPKIEGLTNYIQLQVLVRLHGDPIGFVTIPLQDGFCSANTLAKRILEKHGRTIISRLIGNHLSKPLTAEGLSIEDLLDVAPPTYSGPKPSVTVAVCTRDRCGDLKRCLDALMDVDYPDIEFLVIDNAPSSDATHTLVNRYPKARYIYEPKPGLNWARNRAIRETQGEIIAFTDDDVIVDRGWVEAFARIFGEDAGVMAVTGLVIPYELETEAQFFFERYGGFGRGFERKWYQYNDENGKRDRFHIGAGIFGTGANMAFRRELFDKIGDFDPALDVGTVTNGGGDLEMFFRVLQEGYMLVYEPKALVRHRHRRELNELQTQLTNHGVGFYSYLVRCVSVYPRDRFAIFRFGVWWFFRWSLRRLILKLILPERFPLRLILAELKGSVVGLRRYQKARKVAAEIAQRNGSLELQSEKGPIETKANTLPEAGVRSKQNHEFVT